MLFSYSEQTGHLPLDSQLWVLLDRSMVLTARQGSVLVFPLVFAIHIRVLTRLGCVVNPSWFWQSGVGWQSWQWFCQSGLWFLSVRSCGWQGMLFFDIYVKGSCVLDIHVSCPLAWASSFSEFSPHSVENFWWKRTAQRTLFSWAPTSVLRPFFHLLGLVPSHPVLSGVGQAGRFDSARFQCLFFSSPLVELAAHCCLLVSLLVPLSLFREGG